MSRVTFIRHARLAPPYSNYGSLSFPEIAHLATGKVDPGIDFSLVSEVKKTLLRLKSIKGRVVILHADSQRAFQTSQYIQKLIKQKTGEVPKVIKTLELNEIFFDPEKFMTAEEFMKNGLTGVREGVFNSLTNKTTRKKKLKNKKPPIESVKNIFVRIEKLDEKIQDLSANGTYIICVTHGFLMRILQMYFLLGKNHPSSITKKLLYQMHNFEYGQGFFCEVEKQKNLSVIRNTQRVKAFEAIQSIPYAVGNPEKDASCVTKHRMLGEVFERMGFSVEFYRGSFSWASLGVPAKITKLAPQDYQPMHTFLKVFIPEVGKYVQCDATFHFIGSESFTGFSDMPLTVECSDIQQVPIHFSQELIKRPVAQKYSLFVVKLNEFFRKKNNVS